MNLIKKIPVNENRILSRNMEYLKKNKLKALQNIVAIFKIKYIFLGFLRFISRASRIFSPSLLISCAIDMMVRVFANSAGFNPRSNHTKDSKMVLDATLPNTQYYKVRIKGKVEQSRKWSIALPYNSV